MRKRIKDCLDKLIQEDQILFSENVQFMVGIGSGLKEARMISTRARLFFCRSTPMGCQVTIIWYKDVERITTGKKKGQPYVQLLGAASRILIAFKSKRVRERFKERCLEGVAGL